MQRDEVHERAALARERGELPRVVGLVVHTAEHHVLERHAAIEHLRGFDVVEIGTTTPMLDTTLVLDRSGHAEWAATVATILEPARSVARPDSSRYLDVTVLIGRAWRPPSHPLDP